MQKNFEKLQKELHDLIESKGYNHPETIRISQELDKVVLEMQKAERDKKTCIFENRYCRYASRENGAFECKAPSDEAMTCR